MYVVVFQIIVEEDGMWSCCTQIYVERIAKLRVFLVCIPYTTIVWDELHSQGFFIVDPILEFVYANHSFVLLTRMCQVKMYVYRVLRP